MSKNYGSIKVDKNTKYLIDLRKMKPWDLEKVKTEVTSEV